MLAGVYVPSSYMRVLYSCIILYLFASKFGFFFLSFLTELSSFYSHF